MLNIFLIGLISFFTDISTEMVYPLIPLYLTSAFGATPALIGLIEGFAESVASLLKVFSGYITDRFQRKKALAFIGYGTGIISKILLIFAGSWVGAMGARVIDRFGKGVRTTPRDVLISDSIDNKNMGKAFGLHKSLDMAGSALGILITYFLISGTDGGFDYKGLFYISIIPAVLGLCMFLFIKEKRNTRVYVPKERFWKNYKKLDKQLKLYLLVVFIFTLGNSSNTFLLLKAKATGFDDASVIMLYFIYNISASLLSLPLGKLSDRIGCKSLLVSGYFVFAAVYFGFAVAFNQPFMIGMFILYGAYTAMIAGVERSYIAQISPNEYKGTMLGLHSTIAGVALFPASVIAGLAWSAFGSVAPFAFGACMSLLAAIILLLFMKNTYCEQKA